MARILMIVRPSRGGAFGHVARLSEALAAGEFDVAVAGPHTEHRERLAAHGVELIDIPMGRDPSPLSDLRAVREVAAAISSFAPDLTHAHGSKGPTFARLARYARPRAPVVITPHNFAFANWFATRSERLAYRGVETALGPLATRVICVCKAELEKARSLGLARRSRVVYNGIEPFAEVTPNERVEALRRNGPVIAAVTEFQPPKGVPTLIDAFAELASARPEVSLAIAGDGFMRAEIEAQIAARGLTERVHLLGQLADVTGVYSGADVWVSPSWSESFPYAVLEAMSLARPIAATDVGGVGEAVEDGASGVLVRPRDPLALAAAIDGLLADRERAAGLGAAAKKRVLERFTFGKTVSGVRSVYAELGVRGR